MVGELFHPSNCFRYRNAPGDAKDGGLLNKIEGQTMLWVCYFLNGGGHGNRLNGKQGSIHSDTETHSIR